MAPRIRIALALTLVLLLTLSLAQSAFAGDPSGAQTGGKQDVSAAKPGEPTQDEALTQIGKNKIGVNFVWTLIAGFLVFFMQAGFALVETGFTQAKNAAHTMAMNLTVFLVGAIGYYLVGFPLMFGGVGSIAALGGTPGLDGALSIGEWNILGTRGWFLGGSAYDVGIIALFLFQMVFMDTAATIPTGAMAERVKFGAVVASTLFISMVLYPIFGNWVWGGGWLSQLGAKLGLGHGMVDFAGSGVVHLIGGMAALAGAIVLGPRQGKFRPDGTPVAIPAHDIPMAILGTIILFFGWFGFNPGSTLAGTDLRISVVAVNTMMAGAVGGFVAMLYMWLRYGKPDPSMMCNGALAGLVAITAPSGFVAPWASLVIGAVAGVLVVESVFFIERKLRLDDPVGAVSVHGVNGLWGLVALGLFADGTYGAGLNGVGAESYLGVAGQGVTGLLYGDASQLVAQLVGGGVAIAWGFLLSYGFYGLVHKLWGMRSAKQDELLGLDIPEMGVPAYPSFNVPTFGESPLLDGAPANGSGLGGLTSYPARAGD